MSNTDPLLTTREVAALLHIHPCTLFRWRSRADKNGLRFVKLSPTVLRYRYEDVERLLAERGLYD